MSGLNRSTPIVSGMSATRQRARMRRLRATLRLTCLALIGWLIEGNCALSQGDYEYRWPAFTCESEFRLNDPDALGRELTSVRSEVEDATGLELPGTPVGLTLFSTRRRYVTFVSLETADARRQRGVFISRNGEPHVYSFQQAKLESTLRHESTHALLHSALPYVPLWLDEGLASYFEVTASRQGSRDPKLDKLRWSLRIGWRPELATLESRSHAAELDAGDYRHAWGWVHFLLNESEESRSLLRRYLQNIANGEPPQAMSAFLAVEMPDARERCIRFLSRR